MRTVRRRAVGLSSRRASVSSQRAAAEADAGNATFATSIEPGTAANTTQGTPRARSAGYFVELKLLADVGLLGFPNAGKSTLISRLVCRHPPKSPPYPFTTLTPNLGVVALPDYASCVMADIPGLVPDAHKGKGLGLEFLRHIDRTRVLVHLLDLGTQEDGRTPWGISRRSITNWPASDRTWRSDRKSW